MEGWEDFERRKEGSLSPHGSLEVEAEGEGNSVLKCQPNNTYIFRFQESSSELCNVATSFWVQLIKQNAPEGILRPTSSGICN